MTKIPTEILKLAIEGGWKFPTSLVRVSGWKPSKNGVGLLLWNEQTKDEAIAHNKKFATQSIMPRIKQLVSYAEVALDREFWIALGRKLGWYIDLDKCNADFRNNIRDNAMPCANCYAHHLYNLILTDQDPTEFWREIYQANT